MGASSSSLTDLHKNNYLQRFSGKESISHNDPFWNQVLSFSFKPPRTCADCKLLEESVQGLLNSLLNNNHLTGNFASLVKIFLTRSVELKASAQCFNNVFTWQTYNSLFIIRIVTKYFLQSIPEESLLKHFQSSEIGDHLDGSLLGQLLSTLIEIIVDVPFMNFTYGITLEAINTLIVLLSVQMYSTKPASKSFIYRYLLNGKCTIHAPLLMKTLLMHFINQEKWKPTENGGGSIILGLASGIWNVLTLGYGQSSPETLEEPILSSQSLLLMLVLINHCTNEKNQSNPYRQALFSFRDTHDLSPMEASPTFKCDYAKLFSTLCMTLNNDQTTLLLYILIHRNGQFKTFILARSDVDQLIVPLLKNLYNAPDSSSHHIYMTLIILLILSEDDFFIGAIHDIMLKNVTWYTERAISEISLGGLLVLVLIRTMQYNMTRMRDKYLHTNCLAALANMSSHFKNLHPYVCQKFVGLFEHLGKRLIRISKQLQQEPKQNEVVIEVTAANLLQDMSILEEVIRMLLEVLNSCLSSQLNHNSNLLYTLLYKRQVFDIFRNHSGGFDDLIQNIDTVLCHFSERLNSVDRPLSVPEVSQIIQQTTLQWSQDKLKKFPELKFKYVEEHQPEEFFIPYIWSLIYNSSTMYWNSENIVLFPPASNTIVV